MGGRIFIRGPNHHSVPVVHKKICPQLSKKSAFCTTFDTLYKLKSKDLLICNESLTSGDVHAFQLIKRPGWEPVGGD